MMWSRLTVVLILTSTLTLATSSPKRFSISATRYNTDLNRRDSVSIQGTTEATRHVVVDFTFGGQRIPVSLDTGGSFCYVTSTLDKTASSLGLPALYNPNISTTYHDEHNASDAFTCGGSSSCFMGVDNVATGGFTAENMSFGVATYVKQDVFTSGQSGTMGFGRQANDPSLWHPRDQPFWYRIGASLALPYLFTVDIYQTQNGTFDFGYIDPEKYSGEISYVPMDTSETNWNFNMTGFAIGDGNPQNVTEFTGVVDTGGPNIGLPSSIVGPYFKSFGGNSSGTIYTYPCSAYPPPNLTLYLATGDKMVLNGSLLVTPPIGSSKICNGRVDDSLQSAYNIGASVLDQKFVVFDHANSRIGFADKRKSGQVGVISGGATSTSTTTSAVSKSTSPSAVSTGAVTTTGTASPSQTTAAKSNGNRVAWSVPLMCISFVYVVLWI